MTTERETAAADVLKQMRIFAEAENPANARTLTTWADRLERALARGRVAVGVVGGLDRGASISQNATLIKPLPSGTKLYAAPPAAQHPDDIAVDQFAEAMKAKLAAARAKGRGGWDGPECNAHLLSRMLRDHVEKGDPRDVANFCMFLHQRGESIQPAAQQPEQAAAFGPPYTTDARQCCESPETCPEPCRDEPAAADVEGLADENRELFDMIRAAVDAASPRWGDAHDNPMLHKINRREREWIASQVFAVVARQPEKSAAGPSPVEHKNWMNGCPQPCDVPNGEGPCCCGAWHPAPAAAVHATDHSEQILGMVSAKDSDTRLERAQKLRALSDTAKRYSTAIIDSARAADARAALGPHATRAKMTTANARWARCAEARERSAQDFQNALEALEGEHE